jgi:AraC-like DNA-binding protein
MSTILLLASIQALFLSALLFNKQGKQLSDIVLGVWLTLIGLHTLIYFGYFKLQLQNAILLNLNAGFPFLQGPFLYFYVDTLTTQRAQIKRSYAFHFLPYIIFVVYQLFLLNSIGSSPHGQRIVIHIFSLPGFFNVILLGSVPVYVIGSFLLLKNYRDRILNTFSTIEKINLSWLRFLITGLGVVWLIVIGVFAYMKFRGSSQVNEVGHLIFIAVSLFVYVTGYLGFKQTTVFSDVVESIVTPAPVEIQDENESAEETELVADSPGKYLRSSLKENEAFETLSRLLDYMEKEKPYLDDQLTLPRLATDLGTSVNHLSQIINEHRGQNFFDFVNSYRVDEVKKRLQDPEHEVFSLLAIALECGFGSKSSFNRIFKNATGQTPTQYKRGLKKS